MTNQSEECRVFSRVLITKKKKKKLTVLYDFVIHHKPDNNDSYQLEMRDFGNSK